MERPPVKSYPRRALLSTTGSTARANYSCVRKPAPGFINPAVIK